MCVNRCIWENRRETAGLRLFGLWFCALVYLVAWKVWVQVLCRWSVPGAAGIGCFAGGHYWVVVGGVERYLWFLLLITDKFTTMAHPKKYTPEEAAQLFGVSIERIKEQYLDNAKTFEKMYNKAIATGKKVNNYTAEQLEQLTAEFYQKAI